MAITMEEQQEEYVDLEEAIEEKKVITKEIEEESIQENLPWIFFDYSGTLVDTINALSKTYTRFLGRDFSPKQVKSLYKDFPKLGKIALIRKYRLNFFKFLFGGKNKFENIRKEEFWNNVRTFPGIPEVLLRLRKIVNAKLAIVTHETEIQDEEERNKIFQQFGIPIQFDAIITDYLNKELEFDRFIQKNDIKWGIIIGDTQFDLDLGKKYGFHTIGVTWGFSTHREFNADFIIDDPREILQIVMSLIHKIELQKLNGDPITN